MVDSLVLVSSVIVCAGFVLVIAEAGGLISIMGIFRLFDFLLEFLIDGFDLFMKKFIEFSSSKYLSRGALATKLLFYVIILAFSQLSSR